MHTLPPHVDKVVRSQQSLKKQAAGLGNAIPALLPPVCRGIMCLRLTASHSWDLDPMLDNGKGNPPNPLGTRILEVPCSSEYILIKGFWMAYPHSFVSDANLFVDNCFLSIIERRGFFKIQDYCLCLNIFQASSATLPPF